MQILTQRNARAAWVSAIDVTVDVSGAMNLMITTCLTPFLTLVAREGTHIH